MATYRHGLRRGLPRVAGGEPWPPAGDAPAGLAEPPGTQAAPEPAPAAPIAPVAEAPSTPAAAIPDDPAPAAASESVTAAAGAAAAAPAAATARASLRRGLPRTVGGDPWPPSGAVGPAVAAVGAAPAEVAGQAATAAGVPAAAAPNVEGQPTAATPVAPAPTVALRRGLPRTAGGEPWPPADAVGTAPAASAPAPTRAVETPAADEQPAPASASPAPAAPAASAPAAYEEGPELRRGLPRVAGGDPWPPAGTVARRAVATPASAAAPAEAEQPAVALPDQATPAAPPAPEPVAASVASTSASSSPAAAQAAGPAAAAQQPAAAKPKAKPEPAAKPEPKRYGRFTLRQWIGAGAIGVAALTALAAAAVLFVRWLIQTEPLVDFMTAYPGQYDLPEGAPVGFPGWLGWQHFFNAFLMILIIRSGLQIRREQRPPAYWTPKRNPSGKVSLTIWFHQSLDILWLANGAVFIVLLFATGQWMRVVPTSWEVFPNAVTAMLHYISLDWPLENGWVNYNSLQQLAYFTTIFIAAPLAAATGYRMSGMWPKNAKRLNKAYPVEWARAVHFPVMLYFVVFIFTHVALVFSTGALRNLNHMYAAQGSTDPAAYADNWLGFWMFAASLVVIAAAWVAARPMVLAPIARLFGTVSSR